jgi:NADH-quinone oxidoreductase subunit E
MEFIAKRLDTSMAEVYGVASFYTMFNLKPIGKYHIEVCKSISCKLNGSDNILQHLEKTLHINPGQTTKDNFFTLSKVECLGACGGAPMLSINGKYYENISTKHLDHLLKDLKEEKITINLEGIANA